MKGLYIFWDHLYILKLKFYDLKASSSQGFVFVYRYSAGTRMKTYCTDKEFFLGLFYFLQDTIHTRKIHLGTWMAELIEPSGQAQTGA